MDRLPLALTSFIGRVREQEVVSELLARHRLLTLTGAGGSGKTRLALQVAGTVLERCADGVWLVELAALPPSRAADPAHIVPAVARALGLREEPGRSLLETLVAFLRPRQLLLLLDNCEHVVAACAALAATPLAASPHLQLLATSREALALKGEMAWRVPPLTVPGAAARPEEVSAYEAAALFAERARLRQPAFTLTKHTAPLVAQICRRLDGIPLAIELAAARLGLLSLEKLAGRLDDRFRVLAGGAASRRRASRRCAPPSTGAMPCSTSPNERCCAAWRYLPAAGPWKPRRRSAPARGSRRTRCWTCSRG